jgi:hypothetical protein
MITERDPTPAEYTKIKKSQWWNCVAAALFAVTFMGLGVLNVLRVKSEIPFYGYILVAFGLGYVFVFWRSFRQYKELG